MSNVPGVDDLRLVSAVERCGSIGAAARELGLAQPSASARLGRLERRVGVTLFERTTQGVRATAAGAEMGQQAAHILRHLEGVVDAARAADERSRWRVGTFASIASEVFPVLEEVLGHDRVEQTVDHGDVLVSWVAEGTMDAAFIAIADQMLLPRGRHGVDVRRVGVDDLVVLLPGGVEVPRGTRQPYRGLRVTYSTYDRRGEQIRERLAALGARPRAGVTIATTVAMARRAGHPAVVPRMAVTHHLQPGEQVAELPFRHRIVLSMVAQPAAPDDLVEALPVIRHELGLRAR